MIKLFQKAVKKIQLFFQIWVIEKGILAKDFDRFLMVLMGPIYFESLSAAIRLDLFTVLGKEGALTKDEIAKHIKIDVKPASMLVTVLVTIRLLKRISKDGQLKYKNSVISSIFFDKNKKTDISDIVGWYHYIVYKPMFWFYESLVANTNVGLKEIPGTDGNLYQRLVHHPELERVFENAMEQLSLIPNKMLAEFVDLSKARRLIDVGGGNATNIMALARKNPHLKAMVFDSPSVCQLAQENIRKHGMEQWCSTHTGNCFVDPFPQDIDCIVFSHFLDIWTAEENAQLARKSFDALSAGGQVIILDVPVWENELGPHAMVSLNPYFLALASGHAHSYTTKDYEQFLRDAGFKKIKHHRLPQEHVVIIGTK